MPPPMFQESSESSGEGRDVERIFFRALKCVATVGGLEETLQGLQRHFSLLALTFVIINDFKEEE